MAGYWIGTRAMRRSIPGCVRLSPTISPISACSSLRASLSGTVPASKAVLGTMRRRCLASSLPMRLYSSISLMERVTLDCG